MKNIKVSVIVLTYNHEKYIEQALDSILMQKVSFNYEILVGDDASNDATVSILIEYKKRYPNVIKLFLNNENVGATRNAYNLLMKAEGEYLATCEGDDYWTDENKLQIQVDYLEKHRNLVGCTHRFVVINEKGEMYNNQNMSWIKQKRYFTLEDFEGMFLPGQPSTFLRRNIVRRSSNDFSYVYKFHPFVGDKTLMLLFLLEGSFGMIDRTMSAYRKAFNSSNSATAYISKHKSRFLKDDYKMLCNYEDLLKSKGYSITMKLGKRIIFAKSLAFFFFTADIEYFGLLRTIWNESCDKLGLIFYPPVYYIYRFVRL